MHDSTSSDFKAFKNAAFTVNPLYPRSKGIADYIAELIHAIRKALATALHIAFNKVVAPVTMLVGKGAFSDSHFAGWLWFIIVVIIVLGTGFTLFTLTSSGYRIQSPFLRYSISSFFIK